MKDWEWKKQRWEERALKYKEEKDASVGQQEEHEEGGGIRNQRKKNNCVGISNNHMKD